MDRKVNTILFILGATLFNVIIAVVSFVLLMLFYIKLIMMNLPENARGWGILIIFISSVLISFFAYRAALKLLLSKIDVEKHFDPLFIRQSLKKKDS